jgi:hypoxanthine phosphoribosyltransferase
MYYIFIIIILLLHYFIINGLEKILFNLYFKNKTQILRPIQQCRELRNPPVRCLGMPSGHTELTTLLSYILYKYKYISLPIVFILIIGMCIQRVLFKRHTILQTIIGVIFGFIYALIYLNFKNNYMRLGISLFFIVLYVNLILYEITKLLNKPLPIWIDKQMYSTINKKKNMYYYMKCINIIMPSIHQEDILYITWNDLEYYLNKVIEKLKSKNIQYDGIVGIKTGGAIISDYISKKLNIKNYKIKVKEEQFGCTPDRNMLQFIKMWYKKNINKNNNYIICEGIPDDITNKNIILIDEQISTGLTMNTCIKYLNNKKVNNIFPIVITNNNQPIDYILKNYINIWPWGYDN